MKNTIIEMIKRLEYDVIVDEDDFMTNKINVTLDDFGGFDEHWSETDREFDNPELVMEFIEFLKKNANSIDYHLYTDYHFDNFVVVVGCTSFDI